jgi:hypothetical protein
VKPGRGNSVIADHDIEDCNAIFIEHFPSGGFVTTSYPSAG